MQDVCFDFQLILLPNGMQGTEGIKGIWLSGNAHISSSTLDTMYSSLRVLQLGDVKNVSGKCTEKFEKLVYFKAEITELPFDVSISEQLRYLCYESGKLHLLPKASDFISPFNFLET